jgi:hypothetical protein
MEVTGSALGVDCVPGAMTASLTVTEPTPLYVLGS